MVRQTNMNNNNSGSIIPAPNMLHQTSNGEQTMSYPDNREH